MSRAALLAVLTLFVACSRKDETASNVVVPPGMNVAGTWSVSVMPEDRDTTLLIFMLNATNEATGWKMTLPNREPMDVRILSMDHDSIVFENGPFPSALQSGAMVRTHSTVRQQGDTLVGKTIARYDVKGADSVRILRTQAVRQ
jgi:hypothetical protein